MTSTLTSFWLLFNLHELLLFWTSALLKYVKIDWIIQTRWPSLIKTLPFSPCTTLKVIDSYLYHAWSHWMIYTLPLSPYTMTLKYSDSPTFSIYNNTERFRLSYFHHAQWLWLIQTLSHSPYTITLKDSDSPTFTMHNTTEGFTLPPSPCTITLKDSDSITLTMYNTTEWFRLSHPHYVQYHWMIQTLPPSPYTITLKDSDSITLTMYNTTEGFRLSHLHHTQ